MKPSFRAWFLIIAACVVFHLQFWKTAVILIGFGVAEYLDQRQAKNTRDEIFEDELFGWEPSKDDPEYEDKGSMTRVRLTGSDQILAARIAELLVRMLGSVP